MGRSNKFSAIQFADKRILAVELVHRGGEFELTSITERERSENYTALLNSVQKEDTELLKKLEEDIKSVRKHARIDAPNISFCLDSRWVFIHSFPMDQDLSGQEQADCVSWELSNYLTDSKYKDYVTARAILEEMPVCHASLVLTASAKRDLISFFRTVSSHLGLHLTVIDVDHFGAERALRWNYPEIEQEDVSLFGIKSNRLDATTFRSGRPVQYRWAELTNGSLDRGLLERLLTPSSNGKTATKRAYVYGDEDGVPSFAHRSEGHVPQLKLLNPLRRVELPRRFRYANLANGHRYAPAIGLAMREA
jgi:Tfp pilus assembly PilM family ATPase